MADLQRSSTEQPEESPRWLDTDAADEEQVRPPLTRRRVVETAVRLADEQGLDALSFRKLAAELGATGMAPYSYVRNKDELLDLMLDLVLGEVNLDGHPGGDWVDQLRAMFCSYHRVLLAHPGIARVYSNRVKIGPNGLRAIERTLAVLREAGFTPAGAVNGFFALFNYTIGFELIGQVNPANDVPASGNGSAGAKNLHHYFSALPPEEIPTIASLAPRLTGAKTGRRFEHGLELVLSGLVAKHSARVNQ